MKKPRWSETLFMLGLLLALVYLWFPHKSRQVLWTEKTITAVYRPLQDLFFDSKNFFSNMNQHVADASQLTAENRMLAQQLHDLQMENLVLRLSVAAHPDDKAMRAQHFYEGKDLLPVKILAHDLFLPAKSIFIDAGVNQAVALDDVVVAPAGLVGVIVKVFPDSSQVLLLTDPNFRVDAMSVKTQNRVLVRGIDADYLAGKSYPFLAQSEFLTNGLAFARGEELVTSGFGDIFPAGIPVGKIFAIYPRGKESFVNAEIVPAVDFAKMNALYVLRKTLTH